MSPITVFVSYSLSLGLLGVITALAVWDWICQNFAPSRKADPSKGETDWMDVWNSLTDCPLENRLEFYWQCKNMKLVDKRQLDKMLSDLFREIPKNEIEWLYE